MQLFLGWKKNQPFVLLVSELTIFHAFSIVAIYNEDNTLSVREIVLPEATDLRKGNEVGRWSLGYVLP